VVPTLLIEKLKKMNESSLIRFFYLSLGLLLIVCPPVFSAVEVDSSLNEPDASEIVQLPEQMSQKQMNDLFGEDPYLGQTSYLQSPDGFSQRDK